MFQPNSSPFAGLARVIMTLVSIGVFTGFALSGSDLINFVTNSAKAQAITRQNEILAHKAEIDVENYQALEARKTQLEIERRMAENVAYEESLGQELRLKAQEAAQKMELAERTGYLWAAVGMSSTIFLVLCAGAALLGLAIRAGRDHPATATVQVKPPDRWKDRRWRKRQILVARRREKAMRDAFAQTTSVVVETPTRWSDFRTPYVVEELPDRAAREGRYNKQ